MGCVSVRIPSILDSSCTSCAFLFPKISWPFQKRREVSSGRSGALSGKYFPRQFHTARDNAMQSEMSVHKRWLHSLTLCVRVGTTCTFHTFFGQCDQWSWPGLGEQTSASSSRTHTEFWNGPMHLQGCGMCLTFPAQPDREAFGNGCSSSFASWTLFCFYKSSYAFIQYVSFRCDMFDCCSVWNHWCLNCLQLLSAAYRRLKVHSSRTTMDHGCGELGFVRQDSRESGRWLMDAESFDPLNDYQFRRQRSWDSVRFARRYNPRNVCHERLAESDESLCKSHDQSAHPNSKLHFSMHVCISKMSSPKFTFHNNVVKYYMNERNGFVWLGRLREPRRVKEIAGTVQERQFW